MNPENNSVTQGSPNIHNNKQKEESKMAIRNWTKLTKGDKQIPLVVFKSNNTEESYQKFRFIDCNRIVTQAKVNRMKREILRHDLTNEFTIRVKPSQCGKYLDIYDGQNRFQALCELTMPIHYQLTSMNIDDIGSTNSVQDKWKLKDALYHYCIRQLEDYIILAEFHKIYKYPISTLVVLLSGKNTKKIQEEFRSGNFEITQDVESIKEILNRVAQFREFNDEVARSRQFLLVYIDLLTEPVFEHEKLLHKVKLAPSKFIKCNTQNEYKRMIEKIYNYRSSEIVRLW